ncbi:MAG: glycosyltransferase family 9 protein [Deltaproteobacteria bacterium]|jgi:ADP-heptose:LPS heptosyltransferase|nr:glycosyltransferase family 9 protein [Deltaproteobacteria bacterium]
MQSLMIYAAEELRILSQMTNIRLLIIHQGALGDVVLTFPAISALRQKSDCIDILCQDQIGKLAAKLGLIDKGYPLEAAYFATLFSDQVDAKIINLIRSYEKILVFSFSAELENAINHMSTCPCLRIPPRPPPRDSIHVAEFLFKNLIDGGLLTDADADEAMINRQPKQSRRGGRSTDASKIIIHPGSGSIRKHWPLTRFLDLAEVLEEKGWQPQFVCGPAEPDLEAEIKNHNRQVYRFNELTDLVDWLKTAGGYIGNDSGISHLAPFLGLPSVVIFGPADPKRWKPVGPRVQIVRPELDCHPCFEIEPDNCTQPVCLTDATVASVLTAFGQVYKS